MCYADHFNKVEEEEYSKEAWENLEEAYVGMEKMKKEMIKTPVKQYELLQIKEKKVMVTYSQELWNWWIKRRYVEKLGTINTWLKRSWVQEYSSGY